MITLPLIENDKPLYMQIYQHIKSEIRQGNLKAGFRIPSKRKFALNLGVSVNTIDAAYSQLVSEGFLRSVPKKGYFINELDELIQANINKNPVNQTRKRNTNIRIDFSADEIAVEKFPFNIWRKMIKNAFNEYDKNLLKCTPPQGDMELRHAIATYIYQARGVRCTPEQVIVGAGTDNLLQVLSYILNNDCTIAMENPVYHKAHYFFNRMGHNVLPIPVDHMGIPIEPLNVYNNIAVYITPSHQFPLGTSMPISRRIKLLNWANEGYARYIIEDDYDSEFRYQTKPIPSLQSIDENGKVIYLGTFSKSISASLRISYMVLPEILLRNYEKNYLYFSSAVSRLEQIVLNEFIRSGQFESHVNKMRKIYKKKREHLVREIDIFNDNVEIIGENAGHHLLIGLRTGLSEKKMCENAEKYHVKVYPISPYFIGVMPKVYDGKVLLGYGALLEDEISEGVHLLSKAWLND